MEWNNCVLKITLTLIVKITNEINIKKKKKTENINKIIFLRLCLKYDAEWLEYHTMEQCKVLFWSEVYP